MISPTQRGEKVLVKVCGLRSPEDLTAAEGADLIGVVVDVPDSPRTRTLAQARSLFQRARDRYTTVAVLVDPNAETLERVFEEAAPDLAQVHGLVPPDVTAAMRRRLVPSLPMPRGGSLPAGSTPSAAPELPRGEFAFVHLDSSGGPLPGGTGVVSDWASCRAMVGHHRSAKFLLGGGLNPANVAEALRSVRPKGVDVSSGVESRPGEKSRAKVEQFVRAVREVDATLPEGEGDGSDQPANRGRPPRRPS